eukprot:scaffold2426_cov84-Isochrysis_galbana.AAC.4
MHDPQPPCQGGHALRERTFPGGELIPSSHRLPHRSARTTSTSCASTHGCTTRTPARSAGGNGSSPGEKRTCAPPHSRRKPLIVLPLPRCLRPQRAEASSSHARRIENVKGGPGGGGRGGRD